jgi:hypothetical protein
MTIMLCYLCQKLTTDILDARGSPLAEKWLKLPRETFVFTHCPDYTALETSAKDGCQLCQVFLKAWPPSNINLSNIQESQFMHFKIPFATGQTLCRIHKLDAAYDMEIKKCSIAILVSTQHTINETLVLGFTVGWQDDDSFNRAPLDEYRHFQFFTERQWFCPNSTEPMIPKEPAIELPFLLGRKLQGPVAQLRIGHIGNDLSAGDINERILDHLLNKRRAKQTINVKDHSQAHQKLKREIEKARIVLCSQKSARIEVPCLFGDDDFSEALTRNELYELDGISSHTVLSALPSFNVAKEWLQRCLTTHDMCKREDPPTLPTRVLDVGSVDGSVEPYLFISNGKRADYVALSHCWGGDIPAKTTLQTLATRCASTPMSLLPKTFQHAVIVVRSLGFQYLWIDSLCIIQDSAADWGKESLQMQTVYENAIVTISALDSTSSREGMFYQRKEALAQVGPLQYRDAVNSVLTYYIRTTLPTFRDVMYKGPLNKRAWILQERVLPRAILYFTRAQVYWECRSCYYAESGESQPCHPLLKYIDENSATYFGEQLNKDVYLSWYQLIQDYTGRALTFEKDKLTAVAGLASKFADICKSRYVAGLWKDDIEKGLIWYANTRDSYAARTLEGTLDQLSETKAPSWSWASVGGRIAWGWTNRKNLRRVETPFDFTVQEIKRRSPNPLLTCEEPSHTLCISGLLYEVNYEPELKDEWSGHLAGLLSGCSAIMDRDRGKERSCFALRTYTWMWDDNYIDFLLLEEVESQADVYKRVGFAQWKGKDKEALLTDVNRKHFTVS